MNHMLPDSVERWGILEISLTGPRDGDREYANPFVDVQLSAQFQFKNRVVEADGFYDGEGVYRVRFMPDAIGPWRYVTTSNCPDLDSKSGELVCIEPPPDNHGPVLCTQPIPLLLCRWDAARLDWHDVLCLGPPGR